MLPSLGLLRTREDMAIGSDVLGPHPAELSGGPPTVLGLLSHGRSLGTSSRSLASGLLPPLKCFGLFCVSPGPAGTLPEGCFYYSFFGSEPTWAVS